MAANADLRAAGGRIAAHIIIIIIIIIIAGVRTWAGVRLSRTPHVVGRIVLLLRP